MAAYVIVEISITDPTEYEEYKKLTPAAITAYDGRFVVRGDKQHHWKEIGNPNELLCWNFPLWPELKNGGILMSTQRQRRSGNGPHTLK